MKVNWPSLPRPLLKNANVFNMFQNVATWTNGEGEEKVYYFKSKVSSHIKYLTTQCVKVFQGFFLFFFPWNQLSSVLLITVPLFHVCIYCNYQGCSGGATGVHGSIFLALPSFSSKINFKCLKIRQNLTISA